VHINDKGRHMNQYSLTHAPMISKTGFFGLLRWLRGERRIGTGKRVSPWPRGHRERVKGEGVGVLII